MTKKDVQLKDNSDSKNSVDPSKADQSNLNSNTGQFIREFKLDSKSGEANQPVQTEDGNEDKRSESYSNPPRSSRLTESRSAPEFQHPERYEFQTVNQTNLFTPDPRPGYAQRWVRVNEVRSDSPDSRNQGKRFREGWSPRPADTVQQNHFGLEQQERGNNSVIQVGELVLMEIPVDLQNRHREQVRARTSQQTEGVDSALKNSKAEYTKHYETKSSRPVRAMD